ncbi:hypothetical protein F4820DRAFT_445881 [Hypoxylon rubiginosum]|uniref:Uncharacterized protein n=1 Tax=Hypoxylon rubiginosum TaxID=110542 RepID=A0ACB9Z8L2_9PEZI|nr:hypothetical protein F4820DRAFT_445881 [Hypoxylon rubiginosum]
MDKIPQEIMFQILERVCVFGLKKVRLASRIFYPVATDLLFRRTYASIHRQDLDVLSAMASHPTIRLAVRKVIYVGVYFHYLEISVDRTYPRDEWEIDVGRQFYRACLREQEEMRKSGKDLAIISAALATMPNVRKVKFTNHWGYHSYPPFARSYNEFAAVPRGVPIRIGKGKYEYEPFDYGFKIMCEAISISSTQIEKFSTHYCRNYPSRPGKVVAKDGIVPASFVCSSRELEHCRNAFRHARKITLTIDQSGPQDDSILQSDQAARVLTAAIDLQELAFNGSTYVA